MYNEVQRLLPKHIIKDLESVKSLEHLSALLPEIGFNIEGFILSNDKTKVLEVHSKNGGMLLLNFAIEFKNDIPQFFSALFTEIKATIQSQICRAYFNILNLTPDHILQYSQEALHAFIQLRFTKAMNTYIDKGLDLNEFKKQKEQEIQIFIAYPHDIRKNIKVQSIVTILHSQLYQINQVLNDKNLWNSYPHYILCSPNHLMIEIEGKMVESSYNYSGLNNIIVRTQNFFDVFRYIVTGHQLIQIEGPAGTGKTETLQSIALELGKWPYIFNMQSDQDKHFANIFADPFSDNFVIIFDEYNRINKEIHECFKEIIGKVRKYTRAIYGFTFNPYNASTEFTSSDMQFIQQKFVFSVGNQVDSLCSYLVTQGFAKYEFLSKTLVDIFSVLSQKLSKTNIYQDYGIRHLIKIIRTSANIKRINNLEDDAAIACALYQSFLFRSTAEDSKIIEETIQQHLNITLEQASSFYFNRQIKIDDPNIYKTFKLQSTISDKNILAVTSDETKYIKGLEQFVRETGSEFYSLTISDVIQFYGYFNEKGNYIDGTLPLVLRQHLVFTVPHWIVIRGKVNAVTVENMNSLLDGNQSLSLINGEKLKRQFNCTIVIVTDQQQAQQLSPATISRFSVILE